MQHFPADPPHHERHHATGKQTLPLEVLPGVHVLEAPLAPADALVPEVTFQIGTGTPFDERSRNVHRYDAHGVHELKGFVGFMLRWFFGK